LFSNFIFYSGKIKLDKDEMRKEVAEVKANILKKQGIKPQFAYGYFAEMPDKIAREMNLLPDFDELQRQDPELYRKFYDNLAIAAHWNFKEDPELAMRLMNEIDDIYNAEYEFADESKITFADKVKLFNQKFKYKTDLKL
jgi:hypothetical protein